MKEEKNLLFALMAFWKVVTFISSELRNERILVRTASQEISKRRQMSSSGETSDWRVSSEVDFRLQQEAVLGGWCVRILCAAVVLVVCL
jgi:hypothetical protein